MRWKVVLVLVFNDGQADCVDSVKAQCKLEIPASLLSVMHTCYDDLVGSEVPEHSAAQLHTDGPGEYGRYCTCENTSDAHELGDGRFTPGGSNSALHCETQRHGGVSNLK